METGRHRPKSQILSRRFDSRYFNRFYRGSGDKNPPGKICTYLSIVLKMTVLSVRKGQSFGEEKLKLLDIGCGYGRFLKLAENEFVTYGIDPSEFVINEARKYTINTKFEVATILSYKPEIKFDVITAFDVLEHVPEIEKAIGQIKSWLKPGGIFFCAVPVYDGSLGWLAEKLDRDETHINKWSRNRWLGIFSSSFNVSETWGAVRYSFGQLGYFYMAKPWLFRWGQAILVVMRK